MTQAPFRPMLRELARCYQAFECYATAHIRRLGLTLPQFDILVTLGNAGGLTPKVLGERTLITKGTLTGIIDRLEEKKLIKRSPSAADRRSQVVMLTKQGENVFQKVFPEHLRYIQRAFTRFEAVDYQRIETALRDLRCALTSECDGSKA
ncbi:MAG: MarR family transcriptional regulator [Betaproteobacteria bacterium HGW-Betaproteobacteria-11]|nr:MAG: MarR family transcriptional regulator [Betaproteobacteria bacterium HGW-Betaproteobacteria-11]